MFGISFGFWKIFLLLFPTHARFNNKKNIFFAFLVYVPELTYFHVKAIAFRISCSASSSFVLVSHNLLFHQKYQPNQPFPRLLQETTTDKMARDSMESLDPNAFSKEEQEMLDAFNKYDSNDKGMSVFCTCWTKILVDDKASIQLESPVCKFLLSSYGGVPKKSKMESFPQLANRNQQSISSQTLWTKICCYCVSNSKSISLACLDTPTNPCKLFRILEPYRTSGNH